MNSRAMGMRWVSFGCASGPLARWQHDAVGRRAVSVISVTLAPDSLGDDCLTVPGTATPELATTLAFVSAGKRRISEWRQAQVRRSPKRRMNPS